MIEENGKLYRLEVIILLKSKIQFIKTKKFILKKSIDHELSLVTKLYRYILFYFLILFNYI